MYAIIDVGSNTVRLNIYKLEHGRLNFVVSRKETVGLASYVKNGAMMPAGIHRVAAVLTEFRELLEDLNVESIHVFATAALRNATNSKDAVAEVEDRSKLKIQVISGQEEARLDFIGASTAVNVTDGLLVDIGGGSTELVPYKDGQMLHAVSIPLGSLNTYNNFVKNILPTKAERKIIKQAVLDEIKKYPELDGGIYPIICGVGGTARAANKLNIDLFQLEMGNSKIKAPNLKKMIKLLENDDSATVPVETLDIILRVVPDRVRTLLPGMIVLHTIAKYFKSDVIEVTNAGVRDGYLREHVLPKEE
ncbi:MAG: phosphatase [Selenomonadaceae bacterium]|nr:phosphatase [Selenomonadaceae bacterium]MBP3721817.1 phosphatase [Selenomonadaceae bacterium]